MCFIYFPIFKEPILICSTMLNRNGESRPPFLFLCSKKKLKVLMHLIKCRKMFNILQLILMLLFIVFIATLHEIQLDHTFLTGYSILCLKLPWKYFNIMNTNYNYKIILLLLKLTNWYIYPYHFLFFEKHKNMIQGILTQNILFLTFNLSYI